MNIDREVRLHDAVESAVSKVYAQIWGDNGLTPAESRLAWLQVIDRMIQSAMADRQTEVTAEQMGLKREQAPLDPLRLRASLRAVRQALALAEQQQAVVECISTTATAKSTDDPA